MGGYRKSGASAESTWRKITTESPRLARDKPTIHLLAVAFDNPETALRRDLATRVDFAGAFEKRNALTSREFIGPDANGAILRAISTWNTRIARPIKRPGRNIAHWRLEYVNAKADADSPSRGLTGRPVTCAGSIGVTPKRLLGGSQSRGALRAAPLEAGVTNWKYPCPNRLKVPRIEIRSGPTTTRIDRVAQVAAAAPSYYNDRISFIRYP